VGDKQDDKTLEDIARLGWFRRLLRGWWLYGISRKLSISTCMRIVECGHDLRRWRARMGLPYKLHLFYDTYDCLERLYTKLRYYGVDALSPEDAQELFDCYDTLRDLVINTLPKDVEEIAKMIGDFKKNKEACTEDLEGVYYSKETFEKLYTRCLNSLEEARRELENMMAKGRELLTKVGQVV
jgi:hypothetical protein